MSSPPSKSTIPPSKSTILTQNSPRQKTPKRILDAPLASQPTPAAQTPTQPSEIGAAQVEVYAFSPNRATLGGTAYLLKETLASGETMTILIDCPPWDDANRAFLEQHGPIAWLFITHRGAIGNAQAVHQALGCPILMQEQEAYLLPTATVTPFQQEFSLSVHSRALWTPGHTPGSSCLYYSGLGGVLFSGRHLLPTPQGQLQPIKTATTFHWPRQLQSCDRLRAQFPPGSLSAVCPGANIGFLRGKSFVPWENCDLPTPTDQNY
jgi:glyoxylase-like metal-dependent hydrolase (beta-lactamase superfamily II)